MNHYLQKVRFRAALEVGESSGEDPLSKAFGLSASDGGFQVPRELRQG